MCDLVVRVPTLRSLPDLQTQFWWVNEEHGKKCKKKSAIGGVLLVLGSTTGGRQTEH